jgi:probable DNA repair protein
MTISNPALASQDISQQDLFRHLQAGRALITGNSRLTRVLTTQYNQWRIELGDSQWPSARILSWNLWLDQLWQKAGLRGMADCEHPVPTPRQLITLWEQALRDDDFAGGLLYPESLASQLCETRRLVKEWQLDLSDPAWLGDENENHRAFFRWNAAFEKICQLNGWVAPEDRSERLCTAISQSGMEQEQTVALLGFDEFNPSQLQLLQALAGQGTAVTRLTITPCHGQAVLWQSRDSTDELERMARWVRYHYEADDESTIAVVVPDLVNRRQEVERQLRSILMPGSDSMAEPDAPWNISMGASLAAEPLIQTAFDLLKMLDSRVDIQVIGRVLRSPWLKGGLSERNNRALLEKCLRENYPRQLKPGEVRYRSEEKCRYDHHGVELPEYQQEAKAWFSPKFSEVLERLARFQASARGHRPPSAWAEAIEQLLAKLGWPLKGDIREAGPDELHDRNWQALQSWRDSLCELASLDVTIPGLGCSAAIRQLRGICQDKIFQPKTPPARIQVLGLYEVSGLRFDHLWVLGLHNDNWPPAATPNPFIPGRLQSKGGLPHSSPQRELEVARTISRRLFETASDSVFSYPGQLDGEELLPSPLFINERLNIVNSVPGWAITDWQGAIADGDKPGLHALQMPGRLRGDTAQGGSSIIKHQALCPFRAFATNRLNAEGLESPADGISAMLHGSLVHKVLEFFWTETRSQAELIELDEKSLGERVRACVDRVVGDELFLKQRPAFAGVESDRLHRQAMASLALEKTREPFTAVEFEKEITPVIEGQAIRLFIDRIDRLVSGQEIIIDYKTGTVDPKKWFGDRPEDPQLPLYAITAEETPAAVIFSVIRDDGCLYRGVVSREGLFPGLPPTDWRSQELTDAGYAMPETINEWRRVLHQLMASFLAGEAQIDPRLGSKTCKDSFCKLQALCRIGELEKIQQVREECKQAEVTP